jgi:hypothetical protein
MCSKGSSGVFCKILNGITEQTRNVVENLNEQARAYGGNPIALARVETRVRKAVNFIKQTECAINKISKSEVVYIVAEMKVCSGAVLNYLHSPRTFLISLLDEMRESYKVWRIKSINRTETLIRAVVVVLVCYAFVSIVINLLK